MNRQEVALSIRKLPPQILVHLQECCKDQYSRHSNKEQLTAKHRVEQKTAVGFRWGRKRGAVFKKISDHFFLLQLKEMSNTDAKGQYMVSLCVFKVVGH